MKAAMSDYSDFSSQHLSVPSARAPRRDSIAVAHDSIRKIFEDKFALLRAVWDRVGMNEEQRKERMDTAVSHLVNLVDEMFNEELTMEQQLVESVKMCSRELHTLSKELSAPEFHPRDDWSLMETEEHIKAKYLEYSAEKEKRMAELHQLRGEEERLRRRLLSLPFTEHLSPVPTKPQLTDLRQFVDDLKTEHEARCTVFYKAKKEIAHLLKKLGRHPTTEVERAVLQQADAEFVLSLDNLDLLESALGDLRAEYNEHLAGIQKKIEEMRQQIIGWWDRCCVSDDVRQEFPHLLSDDFSEAAYEAHVEEVARLKHYYEQNKVIFDRVKEWERLFERQMYFEARENDPKRYNNRGGALLREEQERKALEKKLPRVQAALQEDGTCDWRDFKIYGVPIPVYITEKWENFYAEKEREKYERQRAKMEQMEAERKFGVQQMTPLKCGLRTPTKTPTKSRLRNDTLASSCSKTFGHSMMPNNLHSPARHMPPPSQTVSSHKKIPMVSRTQNFAAASALPPAHGQKRKVVPTPSSPVLIPHRLAAGLSRPGNEAPQNVTTSTNASLLSYKDFARPLHTSTDPAAAKSSSFIEEPSQKIQKK